MRHSERSEKSRNVHALILAGGEGTRFAPLSTPECPKQFLALVEDRSLIRQTADRIAPFIPSSHWVVATNHRYCQLVRRHLPELNDTQIIGETRKKNTAPAIALAALQLYRRDPQSLMVVLPSDHVILEEEKFRRILEQAIASADRQQALITLGISPGWPSPDYGYIQEGDVIADGLFRVKRFVEKPDVATARRYIMDGHFVWNSGMFVWPVATLLEEIRIHIPGMHDLLGSLHWEGRILPPLELARFFEEVDSVSIDYGILEKSDRVMVIPADFGWSDVGTWDSLKMLADSGAVRVRDEICDHISRHAKN